MIPPTTDIRVSTRIARCVLATATSAAILLTTLLANAAAEPAPTPPTPPPGPAQRCARATYIRPADGAIVTRTVCELTPPPAAPARRVGGAP